MNELFCMRGPDGNWLPETMSKTVGFTLHKAGCFGLQPREKLMAAMRQARRNGYRIQRVRIEPAK
jgi:hypothetical protein